VAFGHGERRFRLVPVQCFHNGDPRQHFRPVALGDQHQRFHRDLPIGGIMFRFRQRGDVFGGVAQRQQFAPVRQHDRIIEPLEPRHSAGAHVQSAPFAALAQL
jgi:hypothetical protein